MTALAIGILGSGQVASDFAAALRLGSRARVVAVGSRQEGRARQFSLTHGIARAHTSYDELVEDPNVQAVYIALPNSEHERWALRAISLGKHVLCEKPLALTLQSAKGMFAAARARNVVLVEAFPYYFQEQTQRMLECVGAGQIGEIRVIQATIGFSIRTTPNIRLVPELGGGVLLDGGCYPVSLCRLIVGQRPSRVCAMPVLLPTGVEHTLTAMLTFPGGALGQIACSMATGVCRTVVIGGSTGVIEAAYNNHLPAGPQAGFRVRRGEGFDAPVEEIRVMGGNGFLAEAEAFARFIEQGEEREVQRLAQCSIDNAATLEAIALSARTQAWVEVANPLVDDL